MSNAEMAHEKSVRQLSRVMGSLFALADVMLLVGLGFGYVLPRLLAFPDLTLVQAASAVVIVVLLGATQVLLLPVIAVLFGVTS